jgi:polyribonucleotide nucleotidyltransferase
MHNTKTYSIEWGGRTLTIETGKLAGLANGSAKVQYGDTVMLAAATMSDNVRPNMSYFPLQVVYEEKLYAAGKIKGSRFIKREGRPSDLSVINGRITDRSLRPLFDSSIRNDIQVVLTTLSVDQENDPSFVGLIGAAVAVSISDIPWDGPIAGVSVASVDGELILNPNPEQRAKANLYMLMAVRKGKIVMIEAESKQAPEDTVQAAIEFGLDAGQPVIELIEKIVAEVGAEKIEAIKEEPTEEEKAMHEAVKAKAATYLDANMESLFGIRSKKDRDAKEKEVKAGLNDLFETDEEKKFAGGVFEEAYEEAFAKLILEKGTRVDGRDMDEVRELYTEVDLLPRPHGSALFQRGETQVLSVVTLGSPGQAQIIDGLDPEYEKRYIHHYNFPPYSVGEAGMMRGPSRRDIGHGTLAEKALEGVIPSQEEFPYTIRVVSEVLMSNGSSSQASACASSMSLMAAGVPLKAPVAGIAMGLVMTPDMKTYKVLTDIQGVEDHAGDMDFKIAGTTEGVTAIQLDIKLGGISLDICRDALTQGKQARLGILEKMAEAIPAAREEMSQYAPRVETIKIDPERIGEIIGSGGKVINGIIEETGAQIDIEEDGQVFIACADSEGMKDAKDMIEAILKEVEVGEEYTGEVIKIVTDRNSGSEIGAIVDLGGGKDGMVHISNVCNGRIAKVSSVIDVGDEVRVVVKEVDKMKGRIGLSRKDMLPVGEPDPKCEAAEKDTPANDRRSHQARAPRRGGSPDRRRRN